VQILVTSAASGLAKVVARGLAAEHRVRLTDLVDVPADAEFVRCGLDHGDETDALLDGIEVVVHLPQLPEALRKGSTDPENLEVDYHTRCTFNLLTAATRAGVRRLVYASTLHLYDRCDARWAVTEGWRPRPSDDAGVVGQYLGECICREFAREGRFQTVCLRLGNLAAADPGCVPPDDPVRLDLVDAVQAVGLAVEAEAPRWSVYHIQSAFPGSRFSVARAQEGLGFRPGGSAP